MTVVLNIIIVALIALITYWWANQGLLSSVLHFMCVLVAGALAFALWEPVTVGLLLSGGGFDNYAWGVSLVMMFVLLLTFFRLLCDKLVPDNANLPHVLNMIFGGVFGLGSGIISIGILMIGCGFLQSTTDIMGFTGTIRSSQNGGQPMKDSTIFPPIVEWTADFYSMLSLGSLAPNVRNTPMAYYYPDLDQVATSLHRDSFDWGYGKTSIVPDAVIIKSLDYVGDMSMGDMPGQGCYIVQVEFDQTAYDNGGQLTVSASQVRLLGSNGASNRGDSIAVHPIAWVQASAKSPSNLYVFDDVSHYATSVPGRQQATVDFIFPGTEFRQDYPPRFIQIKGVRFKLPAISTQQLTLADWGSQLASANQQGSGDSTDFSSAPLLGADTLRINNNIQPLRISSNMLSPMKQVDRYITSGHKSFPRGGNFNVSRDLMIRGFEEPAGTVIVKLDISRKTSDADIHEIRSIVPRDTPIELVDNKGYTYSPIGYFWTRSDDIEMKFDPINGLRTMDLIPNLPSSGVQKLELIYRVTDGVKIVGLKVGDKVVGRLNLNIKGKR